MIVITAYWSREIFRKDQNNTSDSKVTCKLYHKLKKFNDIYN